MQLAVDSSMTDVKVLIASTIAVPLVQLVPLPPFVWQNAPGGDLALEARSVGGAERAWFPLSFFPIRTGAALAALIPAVAMVLLYRRETMKLQLPLLAIVVLGLLNLLGGALQIVAGQEWFMPYPILERGRLYGFFANHNSAGMMFVVSTCALVGIEFDRKREFWKWLACICTAALLVIGVVLTQSRSSAVLVALPVTILMLRTIGELRQHESRAPPMIAVGVFVAVVLGGLALLLTSTNAQRLIVRFGDLEDARPQIWSDSLYSIERFFPIGSGTGTFSEVFQLDETLENLMPRLAGRAHNEYLEVGVESGAIGWVLLFAWLTWALIFTWRSWRIQPKLATLAVPLALLAVSLQSILDYPLRNVALMCVTGLLIAMLAAQASSFRDRVIV